MKARALSSHFGRNATYDKIVKRFYWYTIYEDVNEFIRKCSDCQKQETLPKHCPKMHPVPVPTNVMQQIGVDLNFFPEVDGYNTLVVAID